MKEPGGFYKGDIDFWFEGDKEEMQLVWDDIKFYIDLLRFRPDWKGKLLTVSPSCFLGGMSDEDVKWYLTHTKRLDLRILMHKKARGML